MAMKIATFICFTTFILSCSSETTTSGDINWWCSQTPHHETCGYYIGRRNLSSTAISTNQFLELTVRAAIDDALVVLNRAQRLKNKAPNGPEKVLWASCVEYFDGIVFRLNMTLDHTVEPTPLDAQTWISSGLAYLQVCRKGFEIMNVTNTMLPIISTNLTQLVTNSLAVSVLIRGSSGTSGFPGWTFRDEGQLSGLALESPNVVVAQDGSGDFTTVQEGVNAWWKWAKPGRFVIYVKAGIYTENVKIPKAMRDIKIFGDGINKTIITGSRHAGGDLKETATVQAWGDGFMARDITIRNTAGPERGQAVALLSASDYSSYYHCSIEGFQDTLFTFSNKQFYKECQIFGTVDFIFGDALVVFQDCEMFLRKPQAGGGLVVAAHGRCNHNESTGYSIHGCKVTATADLKAVSSHYRKAFLGRPWFPRGLMVYMQSFLDDLVDPKGWLDSWGYNETTYCGEYKNYGPGSSTDQRVKWPGYHVITDVKIAESFTVAEFIKGEKWLPATGMPFIPGLKNPQR